MCDRKVFVIPYFGKVPNHIQLWFDSCASNTNFTWLFISDQSLEGLKIPSNIIARRSQLSELCKIFTDGVGNKVCLENPYKLCDFKPLFWMLLDYYKIEYAFWGYCDIDVLFGRLNIFLSEDQFLKYDRIGSFGHLTLIRSTDKYKNAYKLDGAKIPWQKVLFEKEIFGFDEHYGLNRIWEKQKFRYYDTKNDCLDVLPDYKKFFLANIPQNKKGQLFVYYKGKILQLYSGKNQDIVQTEFAYVHFQKRAMKINFNHFSQQIIQINHNGFSALKNMPKEDRDFAITNIQERENLNVKLSKVKTILRYYKNLYLSKVV